MNNTVGQNEDHPLKILYTGWVFEIFFQIIMMDVYFLIIFGCMVILISHFIWKNRGLAPGPYGIPIFGYLPWIDSKFPYITLMTLSNKYGSIYGLYLGSVYTLVLTDPKTIKSVFSNDATTGRAPLYLTHGIMKGYGLICAEGELWKEHRRFIHNCLRKFGASKIGHNRIKMEALIIKYTNDFIMYLKNYGKCVTLDPLEPLRHAIGSIMNTIVFGKSWDRSDQLWQWLQHLQEEGTQHIGIAGPLNFLPFFIFIPKYKRVMQYLIDGKLQTHKIYRDIISEQEDLIKHMTDYDEICNIIQAFLIEREQKDDYQKEKLYNTQQFYHLLADIFGAGLDTTLTTLRWYLLYLAKYKHIQECIRKEINEIVQNRPVSIEDIPFLPLVEASICEVQRIRSVVPIGIPHGCITNMVIEGYRVPKGTMLIPLQWAIHMNEQHWQNPDIFDPYRFLDGEGKFCRMDFFMPFQTGKRMCVGDELAKSMLFLFTTNIIQNFSIKLEDENFNFNGICGITLNPKSHKLIFVQNN